MFSKPDCFDCFQNNNNSKIQTKRSLTPLEIFHIFCNFITMASVFIFVVFTMNEGIILKNATVNYIENTNLTTYVASQLAKIDNMLTNLNQTSGDVRSISGVSKTAVEDGTVGNSFKSVLNSTTHFPEISDLRMSELMGNATRLLGTLASINFSSVTNVLSDVHNPITQRIFRERVDHALRSFDFATLGVTQMFGTIGRAMAGTQQTVNAASGVTSEF